MEAQVSTQRLSFTNVNKREGMEQSILQPLSERKFGKLRVDVKLAR